MSNLISTRVDRILNRLTRKYTIDGMFLPTYFSGLNDDRGLIPNLYNQIINMYTLVRSIPAYDTDLGASSLLCALRTQANINLKEIDEILYRFYGMTYDSPSGRWTVTTLSHITPIADWPSALKTLKHSYDRTYH